MLFAFSVLLCGPFRSGPAVCFPSMHSRVHVSPRAAPGAGMRQVRQALPPPPEGEVPKLIHTHVASCIIPSRYIQVNVTYLSVIPVYHIPSYTSYTVPGIKRYIIDMRYLRMKISYYTLGTYTWYLWYQGTLYLRYYLRYVYRYLVALA